MPARHASDSSGRGSRKVRRFAARELDAGRIEAERERPRRVLAYEVERLQRGVELGGGIGHFIEVGVTSRVRGCASNQKQSL